MVISPENVWEFPQKIWPKIWYVYVPPYIRILFDLPLNIWENHGILIGKYWQKHQKHGNIWGKCMEMWGKTH
jgi:hypothetical protein